MPRARLHLARLAFHASWIAPLLAACAWLLLWFRVLAVPALAALIAAAVAVAWPSRPRVLRWSVPLAAGLGAIALMIAGSRSVPWPPFAAVRDLLWDHRFHWSTAPVLLALAIVVHLAPLWTLRRRGAAVALAAAWAVLVSATLSPVDVTFQDWDGPPRLRPIVYGDPDEAPSEPPMYALRPPHGPTRAWTW